MNYMGKILIVLNLIFSVVVSALIIMVFVRRTDWQQGMELQRNVNKEIVATSNRKLAAKDKEIEDKTTALEREQAEHKDTKKKNDELELARTEAVNNEKKAKDDLARKDLTIGKMQATVETLKVEITNLDERLAERQKKVLDLEIQARKLKEAAIKFEIDYLSAQARNEKLIARLTDLTKEMEQVRGEQAAKGGYMVRNPPPEDVYGKVTQTDQRSGYVTINLGSDNGINKGNTLEIYRRSPRPTYVGVLRILQVRNHEAVGRLVQRNAAVQQGDEVAASILGRR